MTTMETKLKSSLFGFTQKATRKNIRAIKNVKRDNIKLEAYTDLEKKFNFFQIPVYAEMIMGLPGETYKSWIDGLGSLLDSNINNQIIIYQAQVYPNTELNEASYRKKHKIKTKKIELQETHCSPKEQEWLNEYEEIIVETSTMTVDDWKKRNLFSITFSRPYNFLFRKFPIISSVIFSIYSLYRVFAFF